MAKHDRDPVLRQLVRSVNEAGQSAVPVSVAVRGAVLHGSLIAEQRYFAELAEANPMMSALDPGAGLLGGDYRKEVDADAGHYLHLRAARLADADGGEGLWRIRLDEVDGWTLRAVHGAPGGHEDDKGPFARLLSGN
jgi:hypothetical protein